MDVDPQDLSTPTKTECGQITDHQSTRKSNPYPPNIDHAELSKQVQSYKNRLEGAEKFIKDIEHGYHTLQIQKTDLGIENRDLNTQVATAHQLNQQMSEKLERYQHDNMILSKQRDDLQKKYDKKVESFKELDRNYMDLVRPIMITNDDTSTIYGRLMGIRVSIENFVQKAKGDRSINMNKEAAIQHFKNSGLLGSFPVKEADLEPYHLELYMEYAVMSILMDCFFKRPLECIFNHSGDSEGTYLWLKEQEPKIATLWRQHICALIAQETKKMNITKEWEVGFAEAELSKLVYAVYSNVDMSIKITELCGNAFDITFAMFAMPSEIYPVITPLGTPFDDEKMDTPHKSNPEGNVSLVTFPSFRDDRGAFSFNAKVWCY
ncbi:hypothetical protein BGX27_010115 [Mortierella sp. AM989]|nr:hypothetical protein BGX27_010115 [Mortierella sp. AM989]